MQEISQHWDAVYEAMRRIEQPGDEDSLPPDPLAGESTAGTS
jgi:hypothetical protein